ncbi:MAG: hypothetical protein PHS80_07900, partial [Methanothrix sp.]|nr:hypothetical protein [Methanothrix sp.]
MVTKINMLSCGRFNTYLSFRSSAILAIIIALLHLILVAFCETNRAFLLVEDLFVTLTSGLAAVALFCTGCRSTGRARKAWMVIAAALFFNTLGDLSWSVIELIFRQDPFPSVAD